MRSLLIALLIGVGVLAGPAAVAKGPIASPDEGPDPRGLTVEASDVARVKAPTTLSESTIAAAVRAARPAALKRAVAQAREHAAELAKAAGVTLGTLAAVRERDARGEEFGFYTERYCYLRAGKQKCRVPQYVGAVVSATFATAETTAASGSGGAIVASGVSTAKTVAARDRDSSEAIRAAIFKARLAGLAGAFTEAKSEAERVASSAGLALGAPVAITEMRRPPFDDVVFGRFGAGLYCGVVNGYRTVRDEKTGKRRRIKLPPHRICSRPPSVTDAVRVTYLAR